jgi:hypothetical protein
LSETREESELIRLMADSRKGLFCVHVVEQCYKRLADVSERQTGQYILEAITRLLQFSNGMLATNDGLGMVPVPSLRIDVHTPLPESRPPSSLASSSPVSSGDSAPDHSTQSTTYPPIPSDSAMPVNEHERFLHDMRRQVPSQPERPIERPSLIGSIRRMRDRPSAPVLTPLNLAEEIDQVFQRKLLESGLGATDAKVETNPDGGVRIRIGTVYYASADEVPDPRMRDLLKLSVAEWEQNS